MFETLSPQQSRQLPGSVQTLAQLIAWMALSGWHKLLVREPSGAADYTSRKASRRNPSVAVELEKTEWVRRLTPGLRLDTPLLNRSGSIGITRSGR